MVDHTAFMQRAIELASDAESEGEVPVGAVIVMHDEIIGEGANRSIASLDPSAHAEIVAIRNTARQIGNYRLTGSILYTTLEPCVMCAGAIIHARISKVFYAAVDPEGGAAGSVFSILGTDQLNHKVDVEGGMMATQCKDMLQSFFRNRR